jgi:hypothetical protein
VRRQVKKVEDDLMGIPYGWVHFGPKVPKDACYLGRHGDLYAWVTADGLRPLADLTLKVINFSGLIKETSVVTMPGGPRFTPTPSR